METFSVLLALCVGNSPVTGEVKRTEQKMNNNNNIQYLQWDSFGKLLFHAPVQGSASNVA